VSTNPDKKISPDVVVEIERSSINVKNHAGKKSRSRKRNIDRNI